MTSRLDRLFVLLEAGSGTATRRAAAWQLGEIQKAHPEELHRLLGRLMKHIRSPAWETRIAAGQAIEAILSNVPEWHPPPLTSPGNDEKPEEFVYERLQCETFDLDTVLQNGAHLMASQGREYDEEEQTSNTDMKERLAKQRQQLNASLGLDVAGKLGIDLSQFYTNEDLCPDKSPVVGDEPNRRPIQELVQAQSSKQLSSREMNLAKRKARQAFCKQKSRDCGEEGPSAPPTPPVEPEKKKIKLDQDEYDVENASVPDGCGSWTDSSQWPLSRWCMSLQAQLFSEAWEARHGAASALRELLRSPVARGAGARRGMTPEQAEDAHQEWLEDMALRLVCVLALDRFGDFVSDQVVAPVRETCAQTLGVALAALREEKVRGVCVALAALSAHAQWEARHGALLGYKYLLAARQDIACSSGALEQLISGLEDPAEDVSSVAALALVPAAPALVAQRPRAVLHVVRRLWHLLHHQDDLANPANSYMALLAKLMALPQAATMLHPIDLADVLPRLWPYLEHSTSSVRKATLQTLRTLTRPLLVPVGPEANGNPAANGGARREPINGAEQYLNWTAELLQEAMRYIYQRILFEHVYEIQDIAMQVWENFMVHAELSVILVAGCPMLAPWMCLAMQPARLPLDPALILQPPTKERRARKISQSEDQNEIRTSQKWLIGGAETQPAEARERHVMRARTLAANVLGRLSCYLVQPAPGVDYKYEDESPVYCYVKVIIVNLRTNSALQRLVVSLVISYWASHTLKHDLFPPFYSYTEQIQEITSNNHSYDEEDMKEKLTKLAPALLTNTLHAVLSQSLYYDEVALNVNKILQEGRDFLAMMKHYKLVVDGEELSVISRLEQVIHLTILTEPVLAAMKIKRVAQTLEERRSNLQVAVNQCYIEHNMLHVAVQAAAASACANLRCLPEALNPIIRPIMESLKREPCLELQTHSASSLAVLLDQLLARREQCPNNKVLLNLKTYLRCDPEDTPRISLEKDTEENGESTSDSCNEGNSKAPVHGSTLDRYSGILTLQEQQRAAESGPRRGRPSAAHTLQLDQLLHPEDESQKMLRIQRRGATLALINLTEYFGDKLPEKLPKLWEFITEPLERVMTDEELESMDVERGEEVISRLQVFSVVCGVLPAGWWPAGGRGAAAALCGLARARYTAVRHVAARAAATLASHRCHSTTPTLLQELIPALSDMRSDRIRCGAAETLARVVEALQLQIVPYIALLVIPLLGRMSDPCEAVRMMSTRCFAALIQLMPLDGAIPEPANLSPEMQARRARDKQFLDQLFNPKTIKDYEIPIPVSAELRSYQQAGVNWLRFLYEYKLHGVLCDDMGLGKTLQSIVVMCGSHWERARDGLPNLPSLVVTPPTLTGHWVCEVNKFIPNKFLQPLQYVGPPTERERLRKLVKNYNLIVASYDIVRKDIEFFSSIKWNYCILDEGHVIKNEKTKAFKAIKKLIANHRLILSGTPIQNNVVELWSLFEFLMPGLLGTARQFSARYSRRILAARDPRAAPLAATQAARAQEELHRQVLPFLLRRVKEDVLKELPPKITQDYYCELSPLQRRLYEHLAKTQCEDISASKHTHVFQALHYLQNVCNHPKLVLTADHPEAEAVARQLALQNSNLDDIEHSAKLPALKQLLLDCGIGTTNSDTDSEVVVSQHRALIFCQLKKMLDIVEKDLLKKHLPNVTYLRLDGSVPPHQRHGIVARFNGDVSIDLLLLTTQVGGLGLNLTGADTVIFVEHDWNPMKDLQAMDRAHRIGQRKVVNVYRLITRNTLEEKILGLQKFKLLTANTVISSENAAIETMGTDQLLDLFQSSSGNQSKLQVPPSTSKAALETLPELWEDKQYEEEYDMSNFIKGLSKMNPEVE